MPAKDRYHDAVKRALIKDGWTVDDEQITLTFGARYLWIDLKASKVGADTSIFIKVKALDSVLSPVEAWANAIGKYFLYRLALKEAEIDVPLYLAVSRAAYQGFLSELMGQSAIQEGHILLVVFDPEREEIIRWIL